MIIFWKMRILDRTDRQWKDRNLLLDTAKLPAAQRAAVELALETNAKREFLRFRPLFEEDNSEGAAQKWLSHGFKTFNLHEYHEDEKGAELSNREMGQILTGSPTAVLLPAGTEQHHIDYMFSEPTPVPVAEFTLSPDEVKLLGYFCRDLRELKESAFWKDGAGSINAVGSF